MSGSYDYFYRISMDDISSNERDIRIGRLRRLEAETMSGVIAQLVERLICIQEAWGSTPHNSIF